MREWGRVYGTKHCATCGAELVDGSVVQLLTLDHVKRKIMYGPCCAEGSPPPDLPAKIEHAPLFDAMKPIQEAAPKRTRGALKDQIAEWMPYRDSQEREP